MAIGTHGVAAVGAKGSRRPQRFPSQNFHPQQRILIEETREQTRPKHRGRAARVDIADRRLLVRVQRGF